MAGIRRSSLLINVPFQLLQRNIDRIAALEVGAEIYIENNLLDDMERSEVTGLGRILEERGIFCTIHAPYMDLSPGGFDNKVRAETREKLKRTAEFAHILNAGALVCHPGYDKWRFNGHQDLWLEGSVETWTEVIRVADEKIPVILENVFEEEPSTLLALFGVFKEKNLWFCFDTGHFNLFSTVPLDGWLIPLATRLRHFHLHDNHGKSDEHLPVGKGLFPFRELRLFLKRAPQALFVAEAAREADALETIRRAKEFLA